LTDFATAIDGIVSVGQRLYRAGQAPATAGNYSQRLDDGSIAITASGTHKGRLTSAQVMRVDNEGNPLDRGKPSAETLLHTMIYAIDPSARAVLHTHSVPGTVLSRALVGHESIVLTGFELLKVFPHHTTHDTSVSIPLVDNSQDMPSLAARLRSLLRTQAQPLPVFYLRGHGLYVWGASLDRAEMLAEGTEFLLACAWEEWKANRGEP